MSAAPRPIEGPVSPAEQPRAPRSRTKFGRVAQSPVPIDMAVDAVARVVDRRLDRPVWFTGELVQLKRGSSGHGFAVLRGSWTRLEVYVPARWMKDEHPPDGSVVVVRGRLGIWRQGGRMQIKACSQVILTEDAGMRAQKRCETERVLREEGVLDRKRRALPPWPSMVAVVTSARGAAIHDVRATVGRRAPWVGMRFYDCTVQGADAAASMVAALLAAGSSGADLVVLTRGGGDPSVLDPFDDRAVVRAIASLQLPVIVAVGHENDRTLADLAADASAATPTAAAELAVPDSAAIRRELADHRSRVHAAARAICRHARTRARHCREAATRATHGRMKLSRERVRRASPQELLNGIAQLVRVEGRRLTALRASTLRAAGVVVRGYRMRMARLSPQVICTHGEVTIRSDRHRADDLIRGIRALSPATALARGFALVLGDGDRLIRSAADVRPGDTLHIRLHDGTVAAVAAGSTIRDRQES